MTRKRIITLAMLFVMIFTMAVPTIAVENSIMPRLNNTNSAETVFVIDENGLATLAFTCIGYEGITTKIVVETKIQKKFLWWWNDVDGAEWVDETTKFYCNNEHSVQLTKSGTYRVKATYTVYGTGGEADVITREVEDTY